MKTVNSVLPERDADAIGGGVASPRRQRRDPHLEHPSLEVTLGHVVRRLATDYPDFDRAAIEQLVTATSARLLARAKLAEFIPLLTERHVRGWLEERRTTTATSAEARKSA